MFFPLIFKTILLGIKNVVALFLTVTLASPKPKVHLYLIKLAFDYICIYECTSIYVISLYCRSLHSVTSISVKLLQL